MSKWKKLLALVLALGMILSLTACGSKGDLSEVIASVEALQETVDTLQESVGNLQEQLSGVKTDMEEQAAAAEEAAIAAAEAAANTPLVVGYAPFNSKFSPFFSETAYDQDAVTMTQITLLGTDRTGDVVYMGIEGETRDYNGTDYTYYGPADCVVTENEDGTVYYDITIRDDLVFSDGEPLTIDDVIFSMYVEADPTYDGSATLFSSPIEGMEAYRSGMETRGNVIFAAGEEGYEENELFTEDQYNEFWDYYNNQAGADFAQDIVDYCAAYGATNAAEAAELWGFEGLAEDATAADFWDAIVEAYGGDTATAESVETANGGDRLSFTLAALGDDYQAGVETGNSAASITGIQKIDDYNMRIVLTQVDAAFRYQLTLAIAPMHYYGDPELYDYDNNSFGFPKGDLSSVRAKTTEPLGAGPYKFLEFEDGVIYYEANENYFQGAPVTKYLNFQQCMTDADKLDGVVTGTIDISDPSMNTDRADAIKKANGNGELDGDVIVTDLVNNLGYGYIAMSANVVKVGEDGSLEESRDLRRALATVMAAYRDVAIDSYYGELASVINYPISDTSWAAPRPSDDDYRLAFSVDVDGNDIYTSDMSPEEKSDAALQAALGFFEAAGYTVEDGQVTAAPEGAPMEFTFWIPADGIGDHPAFMILTETKKALESIGITFTIKDLANSSELWTAIESEECGMWCAAWGATPDPDMYQVYFSGDDANEPGGSNYMYDIDDQELNELILEARNSTDQEYRKAVYKACLDLIIDWAVELPTYQRQNAIIFSAERVDMDTVTPDITTYYTWLNEIQNVALR